MDPFWEKVLSNVIDKALLMVAGIVIAWVSALVVERYRRHQAVVLELGKLRAQAMARSVSSLWEVQNLMEAVLGAKRTTKEEEAELKAHSERLTTAIEEMQKSVRKDVALLDKFLYERLKAYGQAMINIDVEKLEREPWSEAEVKDYRERLDALREKILAYIPPLPKP